MMGLESATVPATNLRICSCCMEASWGFTRSTYFVIIFMFSCDFDASRGLIGWLVWFK